MLRRAILKTMLQPRKKTGVKLHPHIPITVTSLQRPLSSVPKVAVAISFPELRSPWPAVGKRELWEQRVQVCAIDADCAVNRMGRIRLFPLLFQKLSFSERSSRGTRFDYSLDGLYSAAQTHSSKAYAYYTRVFCVYAYVNTHTYERIYALRLHDSLLCIPQSFFIHVWSIVGLAKDIPGIKKAWSRGFNAKLGYFEKGQWKQLKYFEFSIASQIHRQSTVLTLAWS